MMRQRRQRPGFGLQLAAALLVVAAAAPARPQTSLDFVTLVWNAPAACPTGDHVLVEVARILEGWHKDRVPVAAHVDVVNTPADRWQGLLSLDTRDGHGERAFEAESCQAVAAAAALIIAVAVQGGSLSPPSPSAPVTPPPAVEPTPPPSPPAAAVVATPRPPSPARWSQLIVGAVGLVDAGTMPGGPAGGAEMALGWSLGTSTRRLRVLAGAAYFPVRGTATASTGEGGRFSLFTASLRACASVASGRFELGPCLGAELDRMSAVGVGPAATFEPGSAAGVWGAALGGAVASWNLSPLFALVVRGEGAFTLAQQRFVLQPGAVLVHSPSRVAGRAAVGVELRFF